MEPFSSTWHVRGDGESISVEETLVQEEVFWGESFSLEKPMNLGERELELVKSVMDDWG